jgi:hypothetical protein
VRVGVDPESDRLVFTSEGRMASSGDRERVEP